MKLNIEIDDKYLPALQQHIDTQVTAVIDPATKKGKIVRHYDDIENFILAMIGELIYGIAEQYPTAEMRAQIDAIKQQQAAIRAAATPRKATA